MRDNSYIQFINRFFSFLLSLSVLSTNFISVNAQTRRTTKPKTQTVSNNQPTTNCNGGWSGTISYTQTLEDSGSSDEPGIRKEKDRIIQEWSHNVEYNGRMLVDGSGTMPVALGNVEFSDVRNQHGIEKVWDSCGAWKPEHWFVIDGKRVETTTGSGSGAAKSFNLRVDEFSGTYSFSFQFANVPGQYNLEDHTIRSGHCQTQNNDPIDLSRAEATTVDGETGRVENQKIDPKNPNVLAGSITIDNNDYSNAKRVPTPVTTISWKLKRCSPPLVITGMKFYQPLYPSPNSWIEIKQNDYTIDGNQVKVVATIANLSGAPKTANVNFKELKENTDLPEGNIQVNFEPRQEREVEYIWDTSGYAWKTANVWNQPEMFRQIEVKIPDDVMTKDVEVHPKPVVVVPGLWSKPELVKRFLGAFKSIPTTEWEANLAPVYIGKTAAENAPIIDKTVRDLQKKENAWHIDIVAHSTGGLMARSYVQDQMPTMFDGRPTATHLVMVGTPNMGSPCATGVDNIITKIFNRSADSFREVSIKNMEAFNQRVTQRNGTKFSVLVGNSVEPTCQMDAPGDGISPSILTIWTIKDWKFSTSRARHEDMLGEQANFMQIVNWLAVSPKGNHAPDTSASLNKLLNNNDLIDSTEANLGKFRNYGAMYRTTNSEMNNSDNVEPNFSTGVRLAANQNTEIEIPVTNGSRLSIVLLAPPNVSATLVDDKGIVVGTNLSNTTEAAGTFRTITVKKPFQNGKWKLKLESREQTESEITITAFIDFKTETLAGK